VVGCSPQRLLAVPQSKMERFLGRAKLFDFAHLQLFPGMLYSAVVSVPMVQVSLVPGGERGRGQPSLVQRGAGPADGRMEVLALRMPIPRGIGR
jgi:hypothetical protein